MGANCSPGEKLQTFGLEAELLPRIDAVRKPRYKSRSGFFRAAALDLLARMEAETLAKAKTPYPVARGGLHDPPDSSLNASGAPTAAQREIERHVEEHIKRQKAAAPGAPPVSARSPAR